MISANSWYSSLRFPISVKAESEKSIFLFVLSKLTPSNWFCFNILLICFSSSLEIDELSWFFIWSFWVAIAFRLSSSALALFLALASWSFLFSSCNFLSSSFFAFSSSALLSTLSTLDFCSSESPPYLINSIFCNKSIIV